MQRVIERLRLVKVQLNDQVISLAIQNRTLDEMLLTCEDSLLKSIMTSNIKDNRAIICDSKLDIEEINQVIEILTAAHDIAEAHKKRP